MTTPQLYCIPGVTLAALPAQAQWQAVAPTLTTGAAVPGVLPVRPVNLTLLRATAVVLLQEGR